MSVHFCHQHRRASFHHQKVDLGIKAHWGGGGEGQSSILYLTSAPDEGGWLTSRPGRFIPRQETRYPLCRRLGGLQGRSGRMRQISPPPGFEPPNLPARSELLYRLSYPPFPHYWEVMVNFLWSYDSILSEQQGYFNKVNLLNTFRWVTAQFTGDNE